MKSNRLLFLTVCLLAVFGGAFALEARAAVFIVTTTADTGAGSLRAAVTAANATADADTINFAIAGCPGGICTIVLTGGELSVNDAATAGALSIVNSTGTGNLLISGNGASRVFAVNAGGNLTLSGLTVTGGAVPSGGGIYSFDGTVALINSAVGNNVAATGGGIYNVGGTLSLTDSIVSGNTTSSFGGGIYNGGGTISLTNSTVSGNSARIDGGGIYSNGTVTLNSSTVSGNIADDDGGGIYNFGAVTLNGSTVSGNTAAEGGGIFSDLSGSTTVTGSTVSGNSARFGGGGIYHNSGVTTVTNSTVSGNTSLFGGGIYTRGGTLNLTSTTVAFNNATGGDGGGGIYNAADPVNLRNTIVARNTAAAAPDFAGAVATGSAYNLIGDGTGTSGISNGDAGQNQVGVDPLLDPTLQLNGGATANHALLFGSPAIDKGNSSVLTTDQRGLTRPVDNAVIANAAGGDGSDIGAYETQFGPTAASVTISGRATTASGRGIRNVQITLIDSQGNTKTTQTTTFGYYRFDDIAAGEIITLSVKARQYKFAQPTIVRTTNDSISDADFVSEP